MSSRGRSSGETSGVSTTVFVFMIILIILFATLAAVFFFQNARCQGEKLNNICPNINTNTVD